MANFQGELVRDDGTYCIVLEGVRKMPSTFGTELVLADVEKGECLIKDITTSRTISLSLFTTKLTELFLKASARYRAPSAPICFRLKQSPRRFKCTSVCLKMLYDLPKELIAHNGTH